MFGAVTGAAKSGILDPAVASVNADSGAAGAERVVTKGIYIYLNSWYTLKYVCVHLPLFFSFL